MRAADNDHLNAIGSASSSTGQPRGTGAERSCWKEANAEVTDAIPQQLKDPSSRKPGRSTGLLLSTRGLTERQALSRWTIMSGSQRADLWRAVRSL